MKRRELEKRLRHAGCYLKREGRSHSLWLNPKTGIVEAVPRHADDHHREAVGRDARAVIDKAKAAGVYIFGGGIDESGPPALLARSGRRVGHTHRKGLPLPT